MRILKLAIEQQNDEQSDEIILQGPLADVYSEALQKALSTDNPTTTEVATESQEIDVNLLGKIGSMLVNSSTEYDAPNVVKAYCAPNNPSGEVVVDCVQEIKKMTEIDNPEEGRNYSFAVILPVIDNVPNAATGINGINNPDGTLAIENYVSSMGIPVYRGFNSFLQSRL